MQAECWCWRYETDAAAGIDSILKDGDAAALVAATNAAVQRGDSFSTEELLDSYVRKAHGHCDPEWVRAIERSIARLQSQPNPAGNTSSPSSQFLSVEDAESQRLAGDAEEKKPSDSQPIRPLSKTPAPIIPVRGSGMAHVPKPTQSILDWPPNYPDDLRSQTTVTIGKALMKFPVQTQTLGLCKYVVSKLTPHFCGAVQHKALKTHAVLSVTADLMHYLAVANCTDADDRFRLELEIRKSDEWLELAKGIERESGPTKDRLSPNPRQTLIGRNIDRLRKECGWSLNDCERWTGLDKKLIRGHISGKSAWPKTLRKYAEAFSRELKKTVTVSDLEN
jgi:hypothetical protein